MPAPLQNLAAPQFLGVFRHKVEGRNRITVPADWRFDEEIPLFMISKTQKKCVEVITQQAVDKLMLEFEEFELPVRSNFQYMLGTSLKKVKLDKGGRISIPEELFGVLRLPEYKEVWLTGSMGTFNIWSMPDFEDFQATSKPGMDQLKASLGI